MANYSYWQKFRVTAWLDTKGGKGGVQKFHEVIHIKVPVGWDEGSDTERDEFIQAKLWELTDHSVMVDYSRKMLTGVILRLKKEQTGSPSFTDSILLVVKPPVELKTTGALDEMLEEAVKVMWDIARYDWKEVLRLQGA